MNNTDHSQRMQEDDSSADSPSNSGAEGGHVPDSTVQAPDLQVVSLGSSLTVEHVTDLRDKVLAAFEKAQKVTLSLGSVERIDLAGIHLLYASKKEAIKRGKVLRMQGILNESVGQMLVIGGFCRSTPTDARELPDYLLEFGGRESLSEAGPET
ncbi:MAG: STAS domain-containing protein [Spirochaetota bacterium]